MTTEELRELLVPTHIHYDAGTKSLKDRAFGEIITKVLFLLPEKKAPFSEIQVLVAKFVGVSNLTNQSIQSGLEFLRNKGVVTKQGKFWFLSKGTTQRIEKDLGIAKDRINHILDKNFGTKIKRDLLEKWFKRSVAEFYGKFNEFFSKRLKNQPVSLPDEKELLVLLAKPTTELGMERHKDDLEKGFQSFIKDTEDPVTNSQIWSFAQAMLSAKLVNASVGPDPISVNEFKGADLFLDTNVLFVAALEKSRLSAAFSSLAASIQSIGATFHVTYETCEEYRKVVRKKREEAIRVVESFPISVLEDAKDPFLKTALNRGCVDKAGFENFFDQIADVPKDVGGQKVILDDDVEIKKVSESGMNDQSRKDDINNEWIKIHPYPKPKGPLMHDAALDAVADFFKEKGRNVKVLTTDTAMRNISIQWSGAGNPIWVGLDAFIQLMAVSGAGPAHRPENFGPLLNTVIAEDVYSNDKVFDLEDLDALLDLEERVKELSGDEIEKFATKVAKLRISGKSKQDSELQLEIRRTFQRKKMDHDGLARKLEIRALSAEQGLQSEQKKGNFLESYLVGKITKGQLIKWYLIYGLMTIVLFAIGVGIMWIGYGLLLTHNNLGWFLIGFGFIEISFSGVKWCVPKIIAVPKIAEEKSKELIGRVKESQIVS